MNNIRKIVMAVVMMPLCMVAMEDLPANEQDGDHTERLCLNEVAGINSEYAHRPQTVGFKFEPIVGNSQHDFQETAFQRIEEKIVPLEEPTSGGKMNYHHYFNLPKSRREFHPLRWDNPSWDDWGVMQPTRTSFLPIPPTPSLTTRAIAYIQSWMNYLIELEN